ncbi:MAG: histidinol-phosphate transaminase [Gammaproteobacteria bacterium]|nr:histidinol-phosphate transaminase [Gammaproteobacteria bacterium]
MTNQVNDPLFSRAVSGVQKLSPYPPGKPIAELQRELGLTDIIKMASNENPLGPSPLAQHAMRDAISDLALYPDGSAFALKKALARHLDVDKQQLTIGNGSSEVLEMLVRAYVCPGDEIVFSQYAFAMYPIITLAASANAVVVPARQWGHDLPAMRAAITPKTKIVIVANPNNPTGTWLPGAELEAFVRSVPRDVIVVVDEAYNEFVEEPAFESAAPWVAQYANVVVMRTFSKVYGIAGIRVGYGVASPVVTDILNRVRQPFNVNSLALVAAEAALQDHDYVRRSVELNRLGLRQLAQGFNDLGLTHIPTVANFITVDVGRPALPVYQSMLKQGVIVRPVANYQMPNHLRITTGLPEQNTRCLTALARALAS